MGNLFPNYSEISDHFLQKRELNFRLLIVRFTCWFNIWNEPQYYLFIIACTNLQKKFFSHYKCNHNFERIPDFFF